MRALHNEFTYRPTFYRAGVFGNYLFFDKLDLLGGYIRSHDDWEWTQGGPMSALHRRTPTAARRTTTSRPARSSWRASIAAPQTITPQPTDAHAGLGHRRRTCADVDWATLWCAPPTTRNTMAIRLLCWAPPTNCSNSISDSCGKERLKCTRQFDSSHSQYRRAALCWWRKAAT